MKRVIDPQTGRVHFANTNLITLCGVDSVTLEDDLFTKSFVMWKETTAPVTCPNCARLYCQVKNAPWNELDGDVLDRAIYAAVPGCAESEGGEA